MHYINRDIEAAIIGASESDFAVPVTRLRQAEKGQRLNISHRTASRMYRWMIWRQGGQPGRHILPSALREQSAQTDNQTAQMEADVASVNNWEAGKRALTLRKLLRMSEITGFAVQYLPGCDDIPVGRIKPISKEPLAVMQRAPV